MLKKNYKKNYLVIGITLMLAVIFSYAAHINMQKIKLYAPHIVSLRALPDKDIQSSGFEIWIDEIGLDGIPLDLQHLFANTKASFVYNKILIMPEDGEINIEIPEGELLEFSLMKHDWSGILSIDTIDNNESINLFSDIPKQEHLSYCFKDISNSNNYISLLAFWAVFLLMINLYYHISASYKQKFREYGIAFFSVLLLFLLAGSDLKRQSVLVWLFSISIIITGWVHYILSPFVLKVVKKKQYGILISSGLLGLTLSIAVLMISDFNYSDLWLSNQVNRYPVHLSISPSGEKNSAAKASELWLNYLVNSGNTQDFLLTDDLKHSNWKLVDDTRLFCDGSGSYISYRLEDIKLPASIGTVYSPYSGIAEITLNNFQKDVDLYQPNIEWGFLSIEYLFYNEIIQDIKYLLPLNNVAAFAYYLIAGMIGCLYLGSIPLALFLLVGKKRAVQRLCYISTVTLSIFLGYIIVSNNIYSTQTIEFNVHNKRNQESSGNQIIIYDISSSGVADGNNGQELKAESPSSWRRQYKNGVIFFTDKPTSDSLKYTYRLLGHKRKLYVDTRKNHYDSGNGIFIKLGRGPDAGILSVKQHGEERFIDCYSSYPQIDYIQIDSLFNNDLPQKRISFLTVLFISFGVALLGGIYWFRLKIKRVVRNAYARRRRLKKTSFIFMFLYALYITFALCAQGLLFDEFHIWKPEFWRLLVFILIIFLICSLIPVFLYLLDIYCINVLRMEGKNKICKRKEFFYLSFFSCMSILLLWFFVFYPGVINADVNAQWSQIQGLTFYSNWHPIFHTLLLKVLSGPDNALSIAVFFQLLFISLIISRILTFIYENSNHGKKILIVTVGVLLLPNSVIYIDLTKDILGTYSYIWIVFLLSKFLILGSDQFWHKKTNIIEFIIAFLFVSNIRHNGQFICIPVAVIVLFVSIIHKKKLKLALLSFGLILTLNSSLQLFMKSRTDYYNYTDGLKYVTPINDLASLPANDLNIDTDTTTLLERVMPIRQWKTAYNPYYASDAVLKNNIDYTAIYKDFELSTVLKLYIKNLKKYPAYIIRSRLLGSYLIWGIKESEDPHAYNKHVYFEVRSNPFGLERRNTLLKVLGKEYVTTYRSAEILDVLIWRGGIHIVFLLGLILYLFTAKKGKYILILFPAISFTAALIISTPALNYRYVHYLYLTSLYMIALLPVLHSFPVNINTKTEEG